MNNNLNILTISLEAKKVKTALSRRFPNRCAAKQKELTSISFAAVFWLIGRGRSAEGLPVVPICKTSKSLVTIGLPHEIRFSYFIEVCYEIKERTMQLFNYE